MAGYKNYGMHYIPSDLITVDPLPKDGWETTKDGGGGQTREEIDEALDNSSQVKAKIAQGHSKADFDSWRNSNDPEEKSVGDAYHTLYGGAHQNSQGESEGYPPVRVARNEKGDLVTERGQHIVDRAQHHGGRDVPAEVMAPPGDREFEGKQPMRLPPAGERKDDAMGGGEPGQIQAARGQDKMDGAEAAPDRTKDEKHDQSESGSSLG